MSAPGAGAVGPAVALALHAALLGYLFAGTPPSPTAQPRRAPVRLRAAVRAEPTPPPVAAPPEAARSAPNVPEIAPRVARQAPRPRPEKKIARAETPPVPAPAAEPPPSIAPVAEPAAPPKPRKFTVALGATVGTGGVAVPTSNAGSAWGLSGASAISPDEDDAPGAPASGGSASPGTGGARRADVGELTSMPRLLSQPTAEEMRALYPASARRDALEGDVSLRILVATTGEVVRVRVIRGAGNDFDEAATALVKKFRFRAAEVRGEPVEVWIPWTYKFRLEG